MVVLAVGSAGGVLCSHARYDSRNYAQMVGQDLAAPPWPALGFVVANVPRLGMLRSLSRLAGCRGQYGPNEEGERPGEDNRFPIALVACP